MDGNVRWYPWIVGLEPWMPVQTGNHGSGTPGWHSEAMTL